MRRRLGLGVVRGEREGGERGRRGGGGEQAGLGRQGRRGPQVLGERLDDGQRHPRRPVPQGGVPEVARRAGPPLRAHAVADDQGDRAAVRRVGDVPSPAVGCGRVQGDRAEDARLGQDGVQFADEGPPDRHRRARVVDETEAQPAVVRGAQDGQPDVGVGAQPGDAVGRRPLVEEAGARRRHRPLQWAQGPLEGEGVGEHRRRGREDGPAGGGGGGGTRGGGGACRVLRRFRGGEVQGDAAGGGRGLGLGSREGRGALPAGRGDRPRAWPKQRAPTESWPPRRPDPGPRKSPPEHPTPLPAIAVRPVRAVWEPCPTRPSAVRSAVPGRMCHPSAWPQKPSPSAVVLR